MKVLFICSGNSVFGIVPFIKSQGESLKKNDIDIEYYTLKGKGFSGYLRNVSPLRNFLKKNRFDLIHSHYALCGWVAVLAFTGIPIVVSYMGSDTYGYYNKYGKRKPGGYINIILAKLLQPFVKRIIVKSKNLEKYVYLKRKDDIIPNGIDLNAFYLQDKKKCRDILTLKHTDKLILFLGDPQNERKNFTLLKKAFRRLNEPGMKIMIPYPVPHNEIPLWFNAADVFVLTSFAEGSPNVIKEAMACNCPIVSTDVGDVKEVIGDTIGCYITSFDPDDVADKIKKALYFSKKNGRTKGRQRIIELGLDSESIVKRIISVYKYVLNKHEN